MKTRAMIGILMAFFAGCASTPEVPKEPPAIKYPANIVYPEPRE